MDLVFFTAPSVGFFSVSNTPISVTEGLKGLINDSFYKTLFLYRKVLLEKSDFQFL